MGRVSVGLSGTRLVVMSEVERLSAGKYLSLGTFRKSGEKVATPVWVTRDGDDLYVITGASSGKVKSIRNNADVELAPCDMRGRISGAEVSGTAEILDAAGTKKAQDLAAKRYGLMYRILTLREKFSRGPSDSVGLRITPKG